MIRKYNTGKQVVDILTRENGAVEVWSEEKALMARGMVRHDGIEWTHTKQLEPFEVHKIEGIGFRDRQYFYVEKGERYMLPISVRGGTGKSWSTVEAPVCGLFVAIGGRGFIISRDELGKVGEWLR